MPILPLNAKKMTSSWQKCSTFSSSFCNARYSFHFLLPRVKSQWYLEGITEKVLWLICFVQPTSIVRFFGALLFRFAIARFLRQLFFPLSRSLILSARSFFSKSFKNPKSRYSLSIRCTCALVDSCAWSFKLGGSRFFRRIIPTQKYSVSSVESCAKKIFMNIVSFAGRADVTRCLAWIVAKFLLTFQRDFDKVPFQQLLNRENQHAHISDPVSEPSVWEKTCYADSNRLRGGGIKLQIGGAKNIHKSSGRSKRGPCEQTKHVSAFSENSTSHSPSQWIG